MLFFNEQRLQSIIEDAQETEFKTQKELYNDKVLLSGAVKKRQNPDVEILLEQMRLAVDGGH